MLTKKEIAFIILTKKQRIYWLSNQEYISLQKLFLNKEMKETIEMLANRIESIVINIYKHLHQHRRKERKQRRNSEELKKKQQIS